MNPKDWILGLSVGVGAGWLNGAYFQIPGWANVSVMFVLVLSVAMTDFSQTGDDDA